MISREAAASRLAIINHKAIMLAQPPLPIR
jgi:hypothetical protein